MFHCIGIAEGLPYAPPWRVEYRTVLCIACRGRFFVSTHIGKSVPRPQIMRDPVVPDAGAPGLVCIPPCVRRAEKGVAPTEDYYDPNGQLPTILRIAVSCPWTFPRAKNCSTVRNFCPAFGWAALSSPRACQKRPDCKCNQVFFGRGTRT